MATSCNASGSIEAALRGVATDVTRVGPAQWQFSLANGVVVPVQVRLTETWLELTTAVPETAFGIDTQSWLRFNAGLDGPVRAVRGLHAEQVRLSADLNIEDDASLVDRVACVSDEVGAALHRCRVERDLMVSEFGTGQGHADTDHIARLCVEAGWPATRGAAGDLRVDLDGGIGIFAAHLDPGTSHALRVVVELADLDAYSHTSRHAVGLMLLAVSASVRSVKGLFVEREGTERAAVATAAPWPESAAALDRSLSALAVACRSVGREVPALQDEGLAHAYIGCWNVGRLSHSSVVNSNVTKEEHACLQQQ